MLANCRMRVSGFTFYDYCQSCQKVTKHRIEAEKLIVLGVCELCNLKQQLTELKEVFYERTNLQVTRFKMGNRNNVVTGNLLHALHA